MNDIAPEVRKLYKSSNIYVSIEKGRFPTRWIVSIFDDMKLLHEQKAFLFKRNAIKFALGAASELTSEIW